MNFVVSTKPLNDALSLGIVNTNVSKFNQKSCVAMVTADRTNLTINVEANRVVSEMRLKGSGDSDTVCSVFVDSLLLKQLVATFNTSTTVLEFDENGLILHSGESKFTLPKMIDIADISLQVPSKADDSNTFFPQVLLDKADWKFIKDHQMYAISMSFINAVYTRVWVSESGDVIVGDFDNSLFTHSKKSKLGATCLLSDTIINLLDSLPEGAQLYRKDKSYIIKVSTDAFEFDSEFTPEYEEDVGSYNSDIVMGTMQIDVDSAVEVDVSEITKFLGQSALICNDTEDTMILKMQDKELSLTGSGVDCKVKLSKSVKAPYEIAFKTALLRSVLSNCSTNEVSINPLTIDSELVGIVVWSTDLTTVIAGV